MSRIRKVAPVKTLVMDNLYERPSVAKYRVPKFTYPTFSQINIELPRHMIAVGGTNSGKTTNILRLLLTHMACFKRIYLLSQDLEEALYKAVIEEPQDWGKDLEVVASDTLKDWDELWADLQAEGDADRPQRFVQKVLLIDDMLGAKIPTSVLQAFNLGRKYGLSCVFITSKASAVPTELRNNISYGMICAQQSLRDTKQLFTLLGADLPQALSTYHSMPEYGFVLIDRTPQSAGTPMAIRLGYEPSSSSSSSSASSTSTPPLEDSEEDDVPARPRRITKSKRPIRKTGR